MPVLVPKETCPIFYFFMRISSGSAADIPLLSHVRHGMRDIAARKSHRKQRRGIKLRSTVTNPAVGITLGCRNAAPLGKPTHTHYISFNRPPSRGPVSLVHPQRYRGRGMPTRRAPPGRYGRGSADHPQTVYSRKPRP